MHNKHMLRVQADPKRVYAKLSSIYAFIEERVERRIREKGLELLNAQIGQKVLEVGFGTGCTLVKMARHTGEEGEIYGIDVTFEMVERARKRIKEEKLGEKVRLSQADARSLPYRSDIFDAVYMAFTLELFDTPDIMGVLKESKRVLKPTGKLVVVSIPKGGYEKSLVLRLYETLHKIFPRYATCRPIYLENFIREAGYRIVKTDKIMIAGLFPMKVVVAK